jgi:hypothetical protein
LIKTSKNGLQTTFDSHVLIVELLGDFNMELNLDKSEHCCVENKMHVANKE